MATPTDKKLNWEDFPALYKCADRCSIRSQKLYLGWVKLNLVLLILAAFVGSIGFHDINHKQAAYIITAVLFSLSTGTTILLAARRWDRSWYAGRAVAESAKSLTWKFVCGADPFPISLAAKEVIPSFAEALRELVNENKHLAAALSGPDATGPQVTTMMLEFRDSESRARRDAYLSQRVNEQLVWYSSKSASNKQYRNRWFILLVFLQAMAAAGAVILAIQPTLPWRAPVVFSTLASAALAWGQIKRYQEIAQAYGLASQELSFIAARGLLVSSCDELARFVNDAETAISREHSMWVARRETK